MGEGPRLGVRVTNPHPNPNPNPNLTLTLTRWARDPAAECGEEGRARVQLQRCDGAAPQSWQLQDGWVEGGVQETLSLSLSLNLTLTLP